MAWFGAITACVVAVVGLCASLAGAADAPSISGFTVTTDIGCLTCTFDAAGSEWKAQVGGGDDAGDTAYGLKDVGGASGFVGKTYARTVVRLAENQILTANLSVFQLRDVDDNLIYELYVAADRTLRVASPAGGLGAAAIDQSTSVVVPTDGSTTLRVEVAALAGDSLVVRVNDVDKVTLTGLVGATTGNARYVRTGIIRYDSASASEPVTTFSSLVGLSTEGWLGTRTGEIQAVPTNTVAPTISGSLYQGQTLSMLDGSWMGTSTITFTHQWRRCDNSGANCADIAGATGATYTLAAADLNSTIRVAVIATNGVGSTTTSSLQTSVVTPTPAAPVNTGLPVVSGSVWELQTLTASAGSWLGSPTGFGYQWRRCDSSGSGCVDVVGATLPSYTVTAADLGFSLRVAVSASNAGGSVSASSVATMVVAKKIVFDSNRDGNNEIYMSSADGSNVVRLTSNPANDYGPVVSPDGRKILFGSNRDGTGQLYVMNVDGSGVTRVLSNGYQEPNPNWSPDGSKIVFNSNRDNYYHVYTMNADGSSVVRLANPTATDAEPKWSPDGSKILFYTDRDGNYEIYTTNVDSSNPVRLTNNPAYDAGPSWSPDGNKIAFQSMRDGDWEIYTMNSDGTNVTQLTSNSAQDSVPIYSPDGSKIIFYSDRSGNYRIYTMNADGSNQTPIIAGSGSYDGDPKYFPVQAPANTLAPTISGTLAPGQTLTANTGTWVGNPTPITYTYQWQRCDNTGNTCNPIAGETDGTYHLVEADAGARLKVSVTGRNADGTASAQSGASAVVAAPGIFNVTSPSISGNARSGSTLVATQGTWLGSPTAYAYQWQRCGYSAAVLRDGPGGYWRLGEASGSTLVNQVAGGAAGSLSGSYALGQPGAVGDGDSAVSFGGGDAAIPSYSGINPQQQATIEWWYRGGVPAQANWLLAKSSPSNGEPYLQYGVGADGNNQVKVALYTASNLAPNTHTAATDTRS